MVKTLRNLIIIDGTLKSEKEMIKFNFQSLQKDFSFMPWPLFLSPALSALKFSFLDKEYGLRE